jgi:peptidoglycan/LPS O-acetylase OafA/YrhL
MAGRPYPQEEPMIASQLCFRAATIMGLVGMSWGIWMGISGDHSQFPAHAHLNLVGWVSLFLIGIFYRLHPPADRSRIARVQVSIWILGTLVQAVGVALVYSGRDSGEPLAAVGSLIVVAAMALFAAVVFRPLPADAAGV